MIDKMVLKWAEDWVHLHSPRNWPRKTGSGLILVQEHRELQEGRLEVNNRIRRGV